MAQTLNHIVSDIRNMATSGSNPIDFRIDDTQIEYWVHQFRGTLISQAIDKRQDISDIWVQSISCLDLIEVDKSECCEIETDCKILRTSLQLPNTIETKKDNMILRVLKPNGDSIYKVTPNSARYTQYSKYGNIATKWYLKNNYIYIIDDDLLETITVYGIWDDPTELATYTACDGSTCYSSTDTYPCSKKMAEQITDIVFKKKVMPYMQTPQDNTNNANNDMTAPNRNIQ